MNLDDRDSELSIYKVIVVGQSGVGKTNLISRYVYDKFQQSQNITIGVQFISKVVEIDTKKINLQIWDTAGQQRFRSVNKVFYKNALGVLLLFSIDNKQSFQKIHRWLKQIRQEIDENAIMILVGNKCDLQQRQVKVQQARKLSREQNMGYIQTSAASNINISKTFQLLCEKILTEFQGKSKIKKKQSILMLKSVNLKQQKKNKKCCNSS